MPRRNRFVEAALADLEEVRLFPSDEERRRAIDAHLKAANRPWDLAIGIAVLVAAAAGAWWALRLGLPVVLGALPVGVPVVVQRVLRIAGTIAVYWLVLRALHRFGAARDMRRRLLACGVPVCLKCGYPLRGLPPAAPRCPECGRAVSARARALLSAPRATGAPP